MIKFPSINQLRSVVKHVTDRARYKGKDDNGDPIFDPAVVLPKLRFRGTTKLHGSNAAVVLDVQSGELSFQSRERELAIGSDNAGFALFATAKTHLLQLIINTVVADEMAERGTLPKTVVVFGEWCGGNIQAGVAINGLPKMFVVFAVKVVYGESDDGWYDSGARLGLFTHPGDNIYHVDLFGLHYVDIDFARPDLTTQALIDITIAVEKDCPAGRYFGKPNMTGEGIVWTCIEPGYEDSGFWFKVKGELHSSSKVKVLAPVDVEAVQGLHDFIEYAVTEARLEQGLHNLINEQQLPFEMSSLGAYIRWVATDVLKEEADTIVANNIDSKKIGGLLANKARVWYINTMNERI